MLKDLMKILSENFVSDSVPVAGILRQIVMNDEFKILKMFMDSEDKNGRNGLTGATVSCFVPTSNQIIKLVSAFEKLLKYIEINEPGANDLVFIKEKYFNWV